MSASREPRCGARDRAASFDHLIVFAAAAARGRWTAARRALARARAAGVRLIAAEEVGLMLVLHAGYPAALEGLRLLAEDWPGRARARREGGRRAWARRGASLCRRVYGRAYVPLMARVRLRHPDLATWMIEEGYGRVLSRRGLGARERERVAVAVLAATGWELQLVSHLRGAARLGARPAEVARAVSAGLRVAAPESRAATRRAVAAARRAARCGR